MGKRIRAHVSGGHFLQAIVAYRDAHGPFRTVDDLGEVRGIGPARLEALRALVRA